MQRCCAAREEVASFLCHGGPAVVRLGTEEAQSCILMEFLSGEAEANLLLSYLDGAAQLEVHCWPSAVKKDAGSILVALEDVFGDKENANQLLHRFFDQKQLPGEPIASYSHGLIDIADPLQ